MTVPKDMVIPGWSWAPDGEGPYAASFATREEAVEAGTYGNEGAPFFVVKTYILGPPAIFDDGRDLIETANEVLGDEHGFENEVIDASDEQAQELAIALNLVFDGWCRKHKLLEGHFGIENDSEELVEPAPRGSP